MPASDPLFDPRFSGMRRRDEQQSAGTGSTAEKTGQPEYANTASWSTAESENPLAFVSHLRAIGCPAKIIQKIVTAEIEEDFGKKRAKIIVQLSHVTQLSPEAGSQLEVELKGLDRDH